MTKKDYIALVKEFNLTYDADSTSAYFKEYPICGYRTCSSNGADWSARSLIIFDKYYGYPDENGQYTGIYQDKSSTKVEEARQLISNQIVCIKNKYINERLDKMNKDF